MIKLKIKDNVDLKDLEKYGFKHKFYWSKIYSNRGLCVTLLSSRILAIWSINTDINEELLRDDFMLFMKDIYNLTKDNLLEEVGDE